MTRVPASGSCGSVLGPRRRIQLRSDHRFRRLSEDPAFQLFRGGGINTECSAATITGGSQSASSLSLPLPLSCPNSSMRCESESRSRPDDCVLAQEVPWWIPAVPFITLSVHSICLRKAKGDEDISSTSHGSSHAIQFPRILARTSSDLHSVPAASTTFAKIFFEFTYTKQRFVPTHHRCSYHGSRT